MTGKKSTKNTNLSPLVFPMPDARATIQAFNRFWAIFKKQITINDIQEKMLDEQLIAFASKSLEIENTLTHFQEYLKTVPIASTIGNWIQGKLADPDWQDKYSSKFSQLQKKNLIPSKDTRGQLVTLEYFMQQGHQQILEDIRCVKEWSFLEREETVQCYIQFTHSLARRTCGLVPYGFDPDRQCARHKAIKYEQFIDFVQHLSERDALIAKLFYFGAMTIEEVLALKKNAIDVSSSSIILGGTSTQFPRHVIQDLQSYINDKEKTAKLMFTNLRGDAVDRAHLNQSFSRACEKMSKKVKITPGNLLKNESETMKM